ncbi:MAG: endonuclease [Gemmatimonadetes bacterium]|nr:endonuclease [Gemmatimonadota bacterium]
MWRGKQEAFPRLAPLPFTGRVYQGFSSHYRVNRLACYDGPFDSSAAIAREKQLKRWTRRRKARLIERENAGWLDLAVDWFRRGNIGVPGAGASPIPSPRFVTRVPTFAFAHAG